MTCSGYVAASGPNGLSHSSTYFGTAGISSGRPFSRSAFEKISIFPDGVSSGCPSGSRRKSSNATAGRVTGFAQTPTFFSRSSSSGGRSGKRVSR